MSQLYFLTADDNACGPSDDVSPAPDTDSTVDTSNVTDNMERPPIDNPQSHTGQHLTPFDVFSSDSIVYGEISFDANRRLHSTPDQSPQSDTGAPQAMANPTYDYVWGDVNAYLHTVVPALSTTEMDSQFPPPSAHTTLTSDGVHHATSTHHVHPTCSIENVLRQHTEHVPNTVNDSDAANTEYTTVPGEADTVKTTRQYTRQFKPPFTYAAMCVMAIENADDNRLTIAGLRDALREMFPVFNYRKSWGESIRHTLCRNDSFYREICTVPGPKKEKTVSYWRVDLTHVKPTMFRRQKYGDDGAYMRTLHEELGVPEVAVPPADESDEARILMAASARVARNEALRKLGKATTSGASSTPVTTESKSQGPSVKLPKTIMQDKNPDVFLPYKPTGDGREYVSVNVCDNEDFLNARADCYDDRADDNLKHGIDNLIGATNPDSGSRLPPIPSFLKQACFMKGHQLGSGHDNAVGQGRKRQAAEVDTNTTDKRQKRRDDTAPQHGYPGHSSTLHRYPGAQQTQHDGALSDFLSPWADWYQAAAWATGVYHFGIPPNPAIPLYPSMSPYREMYPGYNAWPHTSVPANVQQNSPVPAFDNSVRDQHTQYHNQWYQQPETTATQGAVNLSSKKLY